LGKVIDKLYLFYSVNPIPTKEESNAPVAGIIEEPMQPGTMSSLSNPINMKETGAETPTSAHIIKNTDEAQTSETTQTLANLIQGITPKQSITDAIHGKSSKENLTRCFPSNFTLIKLYFS